MKCTKCNQDLPDVAKTLIIDGVEYEAETHDFNKILADIKIPKGWRLWKASDFEKFDKDDAEDLGLLKADWFYIEQPLKWQTKYVARFDANSGRAVLYCYGDPSVRDSGLGVRFCREILRGKKK